MVASAWGALGWWDRAGWVSASDVPDTDLAGRYRMIGLGDELEATAASVGTFCGPEAGGEVPLPDLPWGEFDPIPEWSLAVSAPWELQPRLEVIGSRPDAYRAATVDFLAGRGLTVADPEIVQLLRTDLQGDGTDEVIMVAESINEPASLFAAEGDYSVALLRVVVDGEVQTAVLGESVVTDLAEDEVPFILSFRVPAVADLNGDGTMEIALMSAYYEGSGLEILEYVDHDSGPVSVLGVGCGV